jgi:hypothetical protein
LGDLRKDLNLYVNDLRVYQLHFTDAVFISGDVSEVPHMTFFAMKTAMLFVGWVYTLE